jgi:nucleoside 2-deoxyribosyltransferase
MARGQDAARRGRSRLSLALRVYLAGPDVFLPQAEEWAERRKAICARHGLTGVSPLDVLAEQPAEWAELAEWRRIAMRNEALIRSADALIANLTPFRGPSADVGTVYEVGFMRALGRPVFGYSTVAAPFTHRTREFAAAHGGMVADRDVDGMLIEQFGLGDNLMLEAAIVGSGGVLITADVAPDARWTNLLVFERCVEAAASMMGGQGRT